MLIIDSIEFDSRYPFSDVRAEASCVKLKNMRVLDALSVFPIF